MEEAPLLTPSPQVLNIQVFPVAIAATFVTLSWNTSQSLSRDFILQVRVPPSPPAPAHGLPLQVEAVPPASLATQHSKTRGATGRGKALKSIKNPVHQYNNIEVGGHTNARLNNLQTFIICNLYLHTRVNNEQNCIFNPCYFCLSFFGAYCHFQPVINPY